ATRRLTNIRQAEVTMKPGFPAMALAIACGMVAGVALGSIALGVAIGLAASLLFERWRQRRPQP
ncbi:hypothetical protein ACKI1O_53155, partial [Streptomyces scabiei]